MYPSDVFLLSRYNLLSFFDKVITPERTMVKGIFIMIVSALFSDRCESRIIRPDINSLINVSVSTII